MTPKEAFEALQKYGSRRAAAKATGVPRTTLRRLVKRYDGNTDESSIKQQRQDKTIQNLQSELRKCREELLTNDSVRSYILGIKKQGDELPEWVASPSELSKSDNVPIAMWSDFHWGETVRPAQVFALNEFDMRIAADRMQTLAGNVDWLLHAHLSQRHYPGLVLCLAGDMVSGDIHEELTETNEQAMMPVMVDLYGHLRQAIDFLADRFGKLFIPCVYGNHGRTNKKPQSKNQAFKNYDWLLYHLLADWFREDDRITFLIGDDDEVQFEVIGHRYRLTHGAQFRGGTGFIGAIAPITRGEHKKRIVSQSQHTVYDTLLMAHFHQCVWRPRLVVNGSLVGYSEYAADQNLEFEAPKQMLWLTDPAFGKVSPMEVWCEAPKQEHEVRQQFEQVVF